MRTQSDRLNNSKPTDRPRTAWVQERRCLPPIGRRADNARRKSLDEKHSYDGIRCRWKRISIATWRVWVFWISLRLSCCAWILLRRLKGKTLISHHHYFFLSVFLGSSILVTILPMALFKGIFFL
ncbi:uncharacterized protein BDW43DRAFT_291909, partial [Aspergillus alliaceus]|uniref:uncharacterized protein n=1 Tax=Petromyces alliaceus TaxID=209559 RepID=UPI0012A76B4B